MVDLSHFFDKVKSGSYERYGHSLAVCVFALKSISFESEGLVFVSEVYGDADPVSKF